MKLSEAILAGCAKSPKKAVGYFSNIDKSCTCVLGAALLGINANPLEFTFKSLSGNWPFLYDPSSTIRFSTLTNMNDVVGMTREEIAADLAKKGL